MFWRLKMGFMRKHSLLLLLLLLSFSLALSQNASFSLYLGKGFWLPRLNSREMATSTNTGWGNDTYHLGAKLDLAPDSKISFVPALEVDLYNYTYEFRSRIHYNLYSQVRRLYIRASPGLRLQLTNVVHLRLGFSVQVLGTAWGSLVMIRYLGPRYDYTEFSGNLRQVIRPITFGPDMEVTFSVPLKKGGSLDPGFCTYFSLNRTQKYGLSLIPNPWIWQMGMQLGYVLPNRSRN
jgi:hypothetical protein